jgi:hypothetical protein
MKTFHDDTPGQKFIAIYGDGSGCEIFRRRKNEAFFSTRWAQDEAVTLDWFDDSGYVWFIDLPDDFSVWETPAG